MEAKRKAKAIKGMLYLMNRIQALEQLSQWASSKYYSRRGKKFLHIRLSYEKQREILDSKLSLLRFRYPRLYWVARIFVLRKQPGDGKSGLFARLGSILPATSNKLILLISTRTSTSQVKKGREPQ